MLIPRETFLNHFTPTVLVRGVHSWSLSRIEPPDYLPGSLYAALLTSNGRFSVTVDEFKAAVWPLIVEVHEAGRRGKEKRPDAAAFANRLYDVLTVAGIEVTIGPPVEAHGHRMGTTRRTVP